jgi:uncharacterized protein DUF4099/uncharacterized protein DUF3945
MIQQLYNQQDLPMADLQKAGLAENGSLKLDNDDLTALLSGRRTDMLRLQNLFSDGLHIPQLDAKLSLKPNAEGKLDLLVHPIYKQARRLPFLTGAEAEKLERGEVPNIEKKILDDNGNAGDVLVEFDKETNEFIMTDEARILAPDRINGEYLSLDQKERYRKGKEVELDDGTKVQFSATEKQGVRSNRLALIASVLIDGGLSFALYHGLNHLFGEKKHRNNADENGKGYYTDLEKLEQQQKAGWRTEDRPGNQQNRAYTRTAAR